MFVISSLKHQTGVKLIQDHYKDSNRFWPTDGPDKAWPTIDVAAVACVALVDGRCRLGLGATTVNGGQGDLRVTGVQVAVSIWNLGQNEIRVRVDDFSSVKVNECMEAMKYNTRYFIVIQL